MDEPTAALSANEIDDLFRIVAQLKAEGRAIIFISHKFDEIFRIADDFVCLRDGEKVGEGPIASVTEAAARAHDGRPSGGPECSPNATCRSARSCCRSRTCPTRPNIADISFDLRKGEILGLYGLVGAGRTEAMQGLFGITPTTRGTVIAEGKALAIGSPADAIAAGISYVPEDRQDQGAILSLGIRENVTLANLAKHVRGPVPFARRPSRPRRAGSAAGSPSRQQTGSRSLPNCPAATSRRSSSPNGWRRGQR